MPPPPPPYSQWQPTCDTLHAHTQVLGKLAAATAPAEPQLQHSALLLSARGWETLPLPAPDGSGSFAVALDLHRHRASVEHSSGEARCVELTPHRSVGSVTRELLDAVAAVAGRVEIDPAPQEVSWSVALDEDEEHHAYDPGAVSAYFASATQAALALAAFRAPYRGRRTPVNAWWGSFDLAVSLFSGRPAAPPSADFIMRNAMDAQEVAVGWWPGDARHDQPALYAYLHPSVDGFADPALDAAGGRFDPDLGEYVLDWREVCRASDPQATALRFMHAVFSHACTSCDWDPQLASSAHGDPPPVV